MRPGLSIHVVDVTRDAVADGMRVEVYFLGEHAAKLCSGAVNAAGRVDEPILASDVIVPGEYEVQFHVGEFYRRRGHRLAPIPFLDTVPFRFGIADNASECQLSMEVSPSSFTIHGKTVTVVA
jgi:5-hydroxyisourate hydrolase